MKLEEYAKAHTIVGQINEIEKYTKECEANLKQLVDSDNPRIAVKFFGTTGVVENFILQMAFERQIGNNNAEIERLLKELYEI